MNCPDCQSTLFTQLKRTTSLGYAISRCNSCKCDYNERTGTLFNRIEVPTDLAFEVLLCRVRYKLSYRDVAEYFLLRDSSSPMRRCEIGKNGFSLCSLNKFGPSAKPKSARSGRLTKPMYVSKGSGAICIEGLTSSAI